MKGDLVLLVTGRDPITEDKIEVMPSEAEAKRRVEAWATEHEAPLRDGKTIATTDNDTCAYYTVDRETGKPRYKHSGKLYLSHRMIRKDLRERFFVGEFSPHTNTAQGEQT